MRKTFLRIIAFTAALVMSMAVVITAFAYETIPYGEQSDDVRKMQNKLKAKGYYAGAVDGKFGPATQRAVRKFQSAIGLKADGKPGDKTLTALYEGTSALNSTRDRERSQQANNRPTNPRTLYYGCTGARVRALQRALRDAGVARIRVLTSGIQAARILAGLASDSQGFQPDIIVCRSEQPLDQGLKDKIALFCNVPNTHVLQNLDVEYLYEAPLAMEKENLAKIACECLNLDCPEPDLADWKQMVNDLRHPDKEVKIALVGKYTALHDAYISVVEALKHGGIPLHATIDIKWVDSEELTADNVDSVLNDVNGILVPGGFGIRGVEGKILAARYARENNIPYLGLCLGMQVAIIEFARHVCGYNDAHSIELDPNTTHPVIALMPDQNGVEDIGGTLRLGAYPCILEKDSKAYSVYGTEEISERHRHRYEVNNDYRTALLEHGMKLCGTSPDGRIVEMIEIPDHPWFIATQAHPELKSRPNRPHPLFRGFVEAATKCKR